MIYLRNAILEKSMVNHFHDFGGIAVCGCYGGITSKIPTFLLQSEGLEKKQGTAKM